MKTRGSNIVVWAALANIATRLIGEFPSIRQLVMGVRSPRAIARNEAE